MVWAMQRLSKGVAWPEGLTGNYGDREPLAGSLGQCKYPSTRHKMSVKSLSNGEASWDGDHGGQQGHTLPLS